jgi:hypothetical protein
VSNVLETGFGEQGSYDANVFGSATAAGPGQAGTAAAVGLSSVGPDSASIWQSIEVCPNTRYTYAVQFVWAQTDIKTFVASNSVTQGCSLTLSLGTGPGAVSQSFPFGNLPNIVGYTPTPASYGSVSLALFYTTKSTEIRTDLRMTVACDDTVSSSTGYSPTAYLDNVALSFD